MSGWRGASGAFSTRLGGVSKPPFESLDLGSGGGDDPVAVGQNRRLLANALGLEHSSVKTIRQVHGTDVYVLDDPAAKQPMEGYDAIITRLPGVAVGVLTADCVPVLLYDPVARAVGAVHAGWAGTVAGIAEVAVDSMAARFGTDPKDVLAAVGPSIGPCCYEVDDRVAVPLNEKMRTDSGILNQTREGHWLLDLWEANVRSIASAGVPRRNVTIMGMCTACNTDKFYSHRQSGGRTGRMMSLAWLDAAGE